MVRLSNEELEHLARRRAGAKLGWYIHASVYVVVNASLLVFNTRGPSGSWFPMVGWGIGLAFHGIAVFVLGQGSGLREYLVRRERERLLREQDRSGP